MSMSLIVPFASKISGNELPYLLKEHNGQLPLLSSLAGLDLRRFDRIYIVLLREDAERLGLTSILSAHLSDLMELVLLDAPTASQPETIYQTLRQKKLQGAFWVKDPDNYFSCEVYPGNLVATFPLDQLTMVNPQNKSYLLIDDANYIVNIAEKRLIGRFFCSGGYGFADAEEYCRYFEMLAVYGRIYLSHIIYKMLLDKIDFCPVRVKNYEDWGTETEWRNCRDRIGCLLGNDLI